jgi:hypothetical protein
MKPNNRTRQQRAAAKAKRRRQRKTGAPGEGTPDRGWGALTGRMHRGIVGSGRPRRSSRDEF